MKKIKIYAPVDGVVRKLSYGKDAIFSKKILGDGCVIIPTDDLKRKKISHYMLQLQEKLVQW